MRNQLARILSSAGFVSSQRLCRFLRFVVERALEADADRLKEFVVAMEVFDRGEDYDSNVDSIVRVEARRLRGKLKAYYEGPGRGDPVLITMRPGSYIPHFQPIEAAEAPGGSKPEDGAREYTTVAVLPFVNMSPEPEQDYFCDGITEEIINALSSIPNLGVVARTSAFQFKGAGADIREVGERLRAEVVVEGSVRKAGNQLRITAQAIDAARGYHLWSETYRRELHDVFAIQEELSYAIAATLKTKLPARPAGVQPQRDLEAYMGFLQAMFLVHQQSIEGLYEAADRFRGLIQTYPGYAPPYAGLGAALSVLTLFGVEPGGAVLAEVRLRAQEAIRLDAESAYAWAVWGGVRGHFDFDWTSGERCFQRAIELQPGNTGTRAWYGMLLAVQGRLTEARNELNKAAQLNPLAASDHTRIGYLHYLQGEDSQAGAHFEEALHLDPDFPEARLYPALLWMRQQEYSKAAEILASTLNGRPAAVQVGLLGGIHALRGRRQESQNCLDWLDAMARHRYVTPLAHAWFHLGTGDFDRVFGHLSRAVEDRTVFAQFLKVDPLYEPLRKDVRFQQLLASMNLAA